MRFLEWGAGNSTVSILKHSLEEDYRVELTSVEHATSFFPYLVGSLINLLIEKGADFDMEWRTLKGPHLDFSEVRRVLRERRTRENHLLLWKYSVETNGCSLWTAMNPISDSRPFGWQSS